jgi:hypothetical protein
LDDVVGRGGASEGGGEETVRENLDGFDGSERAPMLNEDDWEKQEVSGGLEAGR